MIATNSLELDTFPSVYPSNGSTEIYLTPGQYFLGGATCQVRTLLGSCVAITLWHQRLCFGAISHFMLSSRPPRVTDSNPLYSDTELDGKYADEVMVLMIQKLREANIPIAECQAKILAVATCFLIAILVSSVILASKWFSSTPVVS